MSVKTSAQLKALFASGQKVTDAMIDDLIDSMRNKSETIPGKDVLGFDGAITPQMYGAKGDGIADDTNALLALAAHKRVHFPRGIYRVTKAIVFGGGTIITGDGLDSVFIDGSTADAVNFTITNSILAIIGETPIEIGNTLQIPRVNDAQISMPSGHGLEANDVIMILDETDYSFSASRAYYKEGEFLEIKNVGDTIIYLKSRVVGNNYSTNARVCKMTKAHSSIQGVNIKSMNTSIVTALKMRYLTSSHVDGIRVENSLYAGFALEVSCNISVERSFLNKDTDFAGTSYGIAIVNCQNVMVDKVTASAYRHALTTGGGINYCAVNRFIKITNSTFKSANGVGVGALEFHGNTEHSGAVNCDIIGGVVAAGRRNKYDNCRIFQDPVGNSSPIWLGEINEASISFTNCDIHSFARVNGRGVWANAYFENAVVTRGKFSMRGNNFYFTNKEGEVAQKNGVECYYYGTNANLVDLDFKDNHFVNNDESNVLVALRIRVAESPALADYFGTVQISGNTFEACIPLIDHVDNVIIRAKNTFINTKYYAVMVRNSGHVYVEDNVIINPNQENSGSSATNAAVFVSGCTALHTGGNSFSGGAYTNYAFSLSAVTNLHARSGANRGVILREFSLASVPNIFGEVSHNNTPNGNYVAAVGARYREVNGAIDAISMVKTTATLNTGWRPFHIVSSSNTAGRPSVSTTGWPHFDTQIDGPIWWNGTAYVRAFPNATVALKGVVNQSAAQADTAASDVAGLVADFNSLLGKLRTAGIVAP